MGKTGFLATVVIGEDTGAKSGGLGRRGGRISTSRGAAVTRLPGFPSPVDRGGEGRGEGALFSQSWGSAMRDIRNWRIRHGGTPILVDLRRAAGEGDAEYETFPARAIPSTGERVRACLVYDTLLSALLCLALTIPLPGHNSGRSTTMILATMAPGVHAKPMEQVNGWQKDSGGE